MFFLARYREWYRNRCAGMSSVLHESTLENARERYQSVGQSEAEDRSSRRNERDIATRQNETDDEREAR